jgi:hypothetical protein
MSSNILQNGGTILVRQNGSDIQYSSDAGSSWNTISSFPVQITNTNPLPTNVLTVNLTTDLIITSALNGLNLFDCASDYITFNGQDNTCNMNSVTNFGGLIKNDTSSNITVKNINTADSNNSSTVNSSHGWICSRDFGSGANNVLIDNCSNSCRVSTTNSGGICGINFAANGSTGCIVSKCSNSGVITGFNSSGVCASGIGSRSLNGVTVNYCFNTGNSPENHVSSVGVIGNNAGDRGKIIVTNCYNTGNNCCLCGTSIGFGPGGSGTITDCYNTGDVRTGNGGICGAVSNNLTITNCYNSGVVGVGGNINNPQGKSGGICGKECTLMTIKNCYNTGRIQGIQSGGICGVSSSITEINLCYNTGVITGTNCAGIVVLSNTLNSCLIDKCWTLGDITGERCGGIVCGSDYHATVTRCYNAGRIGGNRCGGICGGTVINTNGNMVITNCYNRGYITGAGAGIIFGNSYGYGENYTIITNCYNSGEINWGSGIGNGGGQNVIVTYCYDANGNWTDNAANANLTGTPASSPGVGASWASEVANTPYIFSYYFPYISSVVASEYKIIDILGSNLGDVDSVLINGNIVPDSFVANDNSVTVTLTNFVLVDSVQVTNPLNLSATFLIGPPPLAPVCFPAGTPVLTDQGIINIEKINPKIHTIQNKKIVAVTQTVTNEKHLVCIEKDALGENKPNQKTLISQCHNVEFNGKFMRAKYLKYAVDNKKSVYNVKYENQILYNILMKEHEVMSVNNMLVETLDPEHIIAKLYTRKFSESEKHNLIVEINDNMRRNDMEKYKEICKRIK